MSRLIVASATVVFISFLRPQVVTAQFDNPTQDVLKKAQDAAKDLKRARYTAEYAGTGWVAKEVPNVHGTVIVGKNPKGEIGTFRAEVTIVSNGPDKVEPIQLTAGCDGENYFLEDKKSKTVYVDIDPAVMGSHSRDVQRPVLDVFTSSKPYEKLMTAKDLAIKTIPEIAGERCFELHATVDGRSEVWYLAWRDYLPRRYERIYKNNEGEEGKTQLTLKNLEVNPELPEADPFQIKVPEGFTKSDDFAP